MFQNKKNIFPKLTLLFIILIVILVMCFFIFKKIYDKNSSHYVQSEEKYFNNLNLNDLKKMYKLSESNNCANVGKINLPSFVVSKNFVIDPNGLEKYCQIYDDTADRLHLLYHLQHLHRQNVLRTRLHLLLTLLSFVQYRERLPQSQIAED